MDRTPFVIKSKPTTAPSEHTSTPLLVIKTNKGEGPTPLKITFPRPFPYESNKVVPWIYNIHSSANSDISSIAGLGGMTRSGRIYTPEDLHDKAPKNKGNEKENNKTEENKESEEETDELLKYIRQSEYSIVDQLHRTPAKITLLSLILSSEPHRQALLKVLNEAYMSHTISQDKFEGIVSHITANDHLTFTDEEIPAEGPNHNKPLHISVKCKEYHIAKVLVDNGSSLNVMPKRTLDQVAIKGLQMRPSNMVVRAFDGSKREVVGEISLPIQIGPTVFNVEFQVMNIIPAYSCLLGRPWIHDAKAVPSTLHQKVKFIVGDKLVTVQAEDDILISKPSAIPYVDAAEEALETAFQALEIANVEMFPRETKKVAYMLTKHEYLPRQGLGKDSQGVPELPIIKENPGKQGLGYNPNKDQITKRNQDPSRRSLSQIFRKAGSQASRPVVVIKCSSPSDRDV
ncbi:uncharacterized protein LOC114916440 [Cajanus cajan]|uniref:uncharacterized protein LOC114916440 n=1 Tax=Cajanus cajan TaxID=3821 RepID=UPI0010FB49AD|nr:uncharacterized protein LOC114916440 [Cajanus cajan]